MSGKDRYELATELDTLGTAVQSVMRDQYSNLDQYQRRSLQDIQSHLKHMAQECTSGKLRPREQRYRYVARLVAEMDPEVLTPELGGRLIDAEEQYRDIQLPELP